MPVGTSAKRPNPSTGDISSRIWNSHEPSYTVSDARAPAFDRDGKALNYYTQRAQAKDLYGLNVSDVASQPIGSQWQVSNRDYPDAYLDGIDSNTRIIITSITDEDLWPVKVAMPWRMHDGVGIDIQWNEWAFHDSYWVRTPEEAVSRYMSNAKRRYQQAMFRWGHRYVCNDTDTALSLLPSRSHGLLFSSCPQHQDGARPCQCIIVQCFT